MKDVLRIVTTLLFVVFVIAVGISWDIYRWHAFQEFTHSNIGYWRWHFIFRGGK